jgi:hypothetical protein
MPRSTCCLDISALSGDPDGGDPFWQSAHVWPIVLTNVACYDMSGNFTYQSGQFDVHFKPRGLAASCRIVTAPAIRPPFRLRRSACGYSDRPRRWSPSLQHCAACDKDVTCAGRRTRLVEPVAISVPEATVTAPDRVCELSAHSVSAPGPKLVRPALPLSLAEILLAPPAWSRPAAAPKHRVSPAEDKA